MNTLEETRREQHREALVVTIKASALILLIVVSLLTAGAIGALALGGYNDQFVWVLVVSPLIATRSLMALMKLLVRG